MRRETIKFWDLVRLILETLRYIQSFFIDTPYISTNKWWGQASSHSIAGEINQGPSRHKDGLSKYVVSHVKDKTVGRPSYLLHGDPYTGKTTSLYWDPYHYLFLFNHHLLYFLRFVQMTIEFSNHATFLLFSILSSATVFTAFNEIILHIQYFVWTAPYV